MPKMKLLYLTNSFLPHTSGVATSTLSLASSMAMLEHRVHILAPGYPGFDVPEELQHLIQVIWLPSSMNPFRPRHRYTSVLNSRIHEILAEHDPDLVHLQEPTYFFFPARSWTRQANRPLLMSHHFPPEFITSYIPLGRKSFPAAAMNRLIIRLAVSLYNRADSISTPSETMRDLLVESGLTAPIEVISNGVDIQRFRPGRRLAGDTKMLPIILYLGRLDPDKNLEILLASFIHHVQHPSQLVFAGTGRIKTRLEQIARCSSKSDLIQFPGFIPEDDLPGVYRQASLFVNPSMAEAQSITTLQAAASGLPLILADAQALPELIKENGYLFNPSDPKELGVLIDSLLGSPQTLQKMGNASRELALKHDFDKTVESYSALYQQLIRQTSTMKPPHSREAGASLHTR